MHRLIAGVALAACFACGEDERDSTELDELIARTRILEAEIARLQKELADAPTRTTAAPSIDLRIPGGDPINPELPTLIIEFVATARSRSRANVSGWASCKPCWCARLPPIATPN